MGKGIDVILRRMRASPRGVRFNELARVCEHFFGEARQGGGSHCVYKMPWHGDPRVNIQNDRGKTKVYQVKQVLSAIEKLKKENKDD